METGSNPSSTRPILKFTAKLSAPSSAFAFISWSYATTPITFDPTALPSLTDPNGLIFLDIGYGVTLVDRVWLAKKLSSQKISAIPELLKVKGIKALKHKSGNFTFITIYIPGIDKKSRDVYASISCKLHLVDRLKINMLMGNNLLCTEGFAINLSTFFTLIQSCDVKIDINARQHSKFLRQKVLANGPTLVPPQSKALIAF